MGKQGLTLTLQDIGWGRSSRTLRGNARKSGLEAIPGSSSLLELAHLLRDAPRFLHERFAEHGRIWKTRLVYPVVFLIGEKANKSILVTRRHEWSFGQGYAQTAVKRIFEGSIMLQDGDDHAKTRDILSPAVGKLAIRESTAAVHRIWSNAAEKLDANGSRTSHDVYEVAQRSTFDVSANVLTGLALGEETDAFRPYFERLIEGIMAPTTVRVPLGRLDRALRARRELEARMRPRVLSARENPPAGLLGQLAHHRDASGAPLPVDEVTRHLLLLFWAGYDTTASSGAWVLHELARRIDWQERLREELVKGDPLDLSRELPLTAAFLHEIERLYPSALFFPRIALQDIEYEGYVIPKGTPTFYSPYMSHRDPMTFENPNVLDPERWLESRGSKRASPAKLVGFGGGPRVCLGKTFAKTQLRLMMHAILTRHRIAPDPTCTPSVLGLPVHHPKRSRVLFDSL